MQIAGKCKDKIAALDPTYYQLTNPSKGYCKRIKRDPTKDKLRKATIIVGTKSKKILDAFIRAKERHGMKDIPHIAKGGSFKNRIILADKEFDNEKFHQTVEDTGGTKSIVPLKYANVPIHRTKGKHRKQLKREGIQPLYTQRSASEANNSAVKRRFSSVLKGKSFWQQARSFYGKYLAYNLMIDILSLINQTFYRAVSIYFVLNASAICSGFHPLFSSPFFISLSGIFF
ncbi:MAG: transposase, partial [archaeon]